MRKSLARFIRDYRASAVILRSARPYYSTAYLHLYLAYHVAQAELPAMPLRTYRNILAIELRYCIAKRAPLRFIAAPLRCIPAALQQATD